MMSFVPAAASTYDDSVPLRGLNANARGKNLGVMLIDCWRVTSSSSFNDHILITR
jgi:hypothetical protein